MSDEHASAERSRAQVARTGKFGAMAAGQERGATSAGGRRVLPTGPTPKGGTAAPNSAHGTGDNPPK